MLRAAEIGAEAVLKATNVDGVYSADPKKDPSAADSIASTHSQAIEGGYKVMDVRHSRLPARHRCPSSYFRSPSRSRSAYSARAGYGTVVAG